MTAQQLNDHARFVTGLKIQDCQALCLILIGMHMNILPSSPAGSGAGWATKQDLEEIKEQLNKIMSAVTDFAAKVQKSFDQLSNDLDGITAEIKTLNDTIQTLQNSPGTLGPADQAALDDIAAKSAALATKADALVVPPVPTPPTGA